MGKRKGRKISKRTAWLLILALTAGLLSACGAKKEPDTGTSGSPVSDDGSSEGGSASDDGSGGTGDSTDASDWTWPLPERKSLSVWLTWSSNFSENPDDLIAIRQIEANTNVDVNWTSVNMNEAAEKFGLMMASGDYPDILIGADSYYNGGIVQANADGILIDLTDYIPKYMPTYDALRHSSEVLQKDTVTDDGRSIAAYTLNSADGVISGEKTWDGLCIRKDWLDELNLEVPETIDDWHEVLTAFKTGYQCEAPLMIGSSAGYDLCHNFLTAYGVLGEFYNDNGTVKFGPLEDGYRQWVQLFRDWYAEGLIDPNFVSNDATYLTPFEYLATGRAGAGATLYSYITDYLVQMGMAQDPNFWLAAAPTPVLNEGDKPQVGFNAGRLAGTTLSVTDNCKDIELACRFLDYWYTEECMLLDSYGIEGESYVKNGDGTYDFSNQIKARVADGEFTSLPDAIGGFYNLHNTGFGLYNWYALTAIRRGDPCLEAYDIWDAAGKDMVLPSQMTMTEEETSSFNTIYISIQTLVRENTIKFINGTQSMDQYDAFLQQLKDYGAEDCIRYKQQAFDRYNQR